MNAEMVEISDEYNKRSLQHTFHLMKPTTDSQLCATCTKSCVALITVVCNKQKPRVYVTIL